MFQGVHEKAALIKGDIRMKNSGLILPSDWSKAKASRKDTDLHHSAPHDPDKDQYVKDLYENYEALLRMMGRINPKT